MSLIQRSLIRRASLLLAVAAFAAACSTERVASPGDAAWSLPSGASPAIALASPVAVRGAKWAQALTQDITVSAVIGSAGGTLSLPQTGLTITVPAGAVSGPTLFSVTALHGQMVAYQFEPHGTKFAVPLQMAQDLGVLDAASLAKMSALSVGYFADQSALDDNDDQGQCSEYTAKMLDAANNRLVFWVKHFSGYMVSSGRYNEDSQ